MENCARLRDLEILSGLRFLPSLTPEVKVHTLTFLPEGLWERMGWLDAMGASGGCPDMNEPICPEG